MDCSYSCNALLLLPWTGWFPHCLGLKSQSDASYVKACLTANRQVGLPLCHLHRYGYCGTAIARYSLFLQIPRAVSVLSPKETPSPKTAVANGARSSVLAKSASPKAMSPKPAALEGKATAPAEPTTDAKGAPHLVWCLRKMPVQSCRVLSGFPHSKKRCVAFLLTTSQMECIGD